MCAVSSEKVPANISIMHSSDHPAPAHSTIQAFAIYSYSSSRHLLSIEPANAQADLGLRCPPEETFSHGPAQIENCIIYTFSH